MDIPEVLRLRPVIVAIIAAFLGPVPMAEARYVVTNPDFEKTPWLAGWTSVAAITPLAETPSAISGTSLHIPAHAPPVETSATSGVTQDLRDPGTGTYAPQSDFTVSFDFRLLEMGGSGRNITFGLKNGSANVIVINVVNGVMQAFDGANWRNLHTTAEYHFNSTEAVYHLVLECSGLGTPAAKYNLSFTDQNSNGLSFSDLTYMTNARVGTVLFNNAYTGHAFLIDNLTFELTSPTGYVSWVEAIPDLSDPTHHADPDGDGLENILEYIVGGDPKAASAAPIREPEISGTDRVFTFNRREQATADTTQTFQYSTDLETWADLALTAPADPPVTLGTPVGGVQPITVTLPSSLAPDGRLFARLQAEAGAPAVDGVIAVDANFEGGSARVMSINQATRAVKINPGGDSRRGWPCWWYVRVKGLNIGETLTFQVDASGMTQGNGAAISPAWALPSRIAVSSDDEAWSHSAPGSIGSTGTWQIPVTAKTMWLAWGPPFTPADSAKLVNDTAQSPHAEAFELCKSNEGRSVPALRVTQDRNFADTTRRHVWVNARAHAWESGSSWSCKGLVDWLVSADPRAEALRNRAIVTIVPILDIDNTFLGNGGKEGLPQDHNRDWSSDPFFAEVRASQELIAGLHQTGRFDLFLEMHNPGPTDTKAVFYIPPSSLLSSQGNANLNAFIAAGATEITTPMVLDTNEVIVNSGYHPRWQYVSFNWVCALVGQSGAFGLCLEIPWNIASSTTDGYLAIGRQQGLAIERYLRVP